MLVGGVKLGIYVITVRHFASRHRSIEQQCASFGLQFQYIFPHDFDRLDGYQGFSLSPNLSPKSISNALKHLEAQRAFLESEFDVALVLEDDVLLFDQFMEALSSAIEEIVSYELNSGWLVFFGGADNKINRSMLYKNSDNFLVQSLTTAEAYALDRVGCRRRLEALADQVIDRQADHLIKKVDSELGILHLRTITPYATQGSITGVFDTSLDENRAKHSKIYLRLRYLWKRFRHSSYF